MTLVGQQWADSKVLHGLCTQGMTATAVYDKFCGNDPLRFKKMANRFTSYVFPGETLVVEMFKEQNTVIFQTKTKERGKIVLVGYVELRETAKL